ncbi:MAG: polyprenyl diphosphate synthase [Candidatus Ranarchaeia archaeon]
MVNFLAPIYRLYEWRLYKQIHKHLREYNEENQNDQDSKAIPMHIGVILDGNRRYAQAKGIDPEKSHSLGASKTREFLDWCWQLGIKIITLYTLSTDNLTRSENELSEIFNLANEYFTEITSNESIKKYNVKVRAIGKITQLPEEVQDSIKLAQDSTISHNDYVLNIAIGYGGRQEIIEAVQKIATQVKDGKITSDEINVETFNRFLYTAGLPDPDLIIRTSGEERISGFLLWQSAYSELYFCEVLWPDIRKIDLMRAIRTYQQRHRRFGK